MTRTTPGPLLITALVVICVAASMAMPQLQAAGCAMTARVRRVALGIAVAFSFLVLTQWRLAQWFFTPQAATNPATKEHFWIPGPGYARNAIVQHGVLDSGVDLLAKPFTTEGLGRKLQEVLRRD
jgi:hypothetical protein